MATVIEPQTQGSLGLLQAGSHRDLGRGDGVGIYGSPQSVPRYAASDLDIDALLRGHVCTAVLRHEGGTRSHLEDEPTTSTSSPGSVGDVFTFTPQGQSPQAFEFPWEAAPSTPVVLKRCRHRLDVDGPNTAALSSKKRRLRADLITSRLSQPYSLPATHILNRQGIKSGDKRFLKMATSLDVARQIAHLHATSFLRYSVMNRLRKRLGLGLGLGRPCEGPHDGEQARGSKELDASFEASWKPQAASGGRYIRSHTDVSPPGVSAAPLPPSNESKAQACRLSRPAALPLPPSDLAAAKMRTSSRIHPVKSPELRPERAAYDELDEDSFSFLYSDEDGLSDVDDDPEQVYSDFSVIFGGDTSDVHSDDHSYEEYLDELDGISWVAM